MAEFRLSGPAEDQIDEILVRSEEKFGVLSRERYAALLVAAMNEVATNPYGNMVTWKQLSSGKIGIFHIEHCRRRVSDPPGIVKEPRHLLIFRVAHDDVVNIIGVLHDSMLLDRAIRRVVRMNPDAEPSG